MPAKYLHRILFLLYLTLLLSALCSFRAITSIGIVVLLAAGIVTGIVEKRQRVIQEQERISKEQASIPNELQHIIAAQIPRPGIFARRQPQGPLSILLIATVIFVLLQFNGESFWNHVRVKSSALIIVLCFYVYRFINRERFLQLMTFFSWLIALTLLYCLIIAFTKYPQQGKLVFFYHHLVSPFHHHAVHFSIIVFAGFLFLVETAHEKLYISNRIVHGCLLGILLLGLLLLSSKLVIGMMVLYLLLFFIQSAYKIVALCVLALTLLVVCTPNPVGYRFRDMVHGNVSVVKQASFSPGDYFNGLQFRLLQWRFTAEILNEQHAWFRGVSPGAAQPLLDQKYLSTHMYTGQAGRDGKGFLGANAHNQFLEALLQTGIIGLLSFLGICAGLIGLAIQQKNRALSILILLVICYSFTESVLETQYGIFTFLFLPLLFHSAAKAR